jgi:hypothetical protein
MITAVLQFANTIIIDQCCLLIGIRGTFNGGHYRCHLRFPIDRIGNVYYTRLTRLDRFMRIDIFPYSLTILYTIKAFRLLVKCYGMQNLLL